MEECLRKQWELRNKLYPECQWVFSWFDLRSDQDGQRIGKFDGLWQAAVEELNRKLKEDKRPPIDLHVHDLRRSARYQMRKAGIDPKTRRAFMGHKSNSMDDRYTIMDDEAFDVAIKKINDYQQQRGMMSEIKALAARVVSLTDPDFQRLVFLRQQLAAKPPESPDFH
jgi:integrase